MQPVVVFERSGLNAHKDSALTDLKAADDARQSQWLVDALGSFYTVGSIVPQGYACYARVLHPAWQCALEDGHVARRPVAWAEVASRRGRAAHRLMQWPHVSGLPKIDDDVDYQLARGGCVILGWPDEGTVPLMVAAELQDILLSHTENPDSCWFGLWIGFGPGCQLGLGKPKKIGNQDRQWYLFRGSLENIEYSFSGARSTMKCNA